MRSVGNNLLPRYEALVAMSKQAAELDKEVGVARDQADTAAKQMARLLPYKEAAEKLQEKREQLEVARLKLPAGTVRRLQDEVDEVVPKVAQAVARLAVRDPGVRGCLPPAGGGGAVQRGVAATGVAGKHAPRRLLSRAALSLSLSHPHPPPLPPSVPRHTCRAQELEDPPGLAEKKAAAERAVKAAKDAVTEARMAHTKASGGGGGALCGGGV
jgi:hypothetical protein